ncbi:hypothetical protein E4U42_007367 [Claviceps africana]|uniref:Uncharacterized protein n=1 Tax=Claviceps africana TaxID=83212 RepID=A0A8K0J1T7_9HYPO|nr:hypothetical protein E4U42_007367 [Claviceps africana]
MPARQLELFSTPILITFTRFISLVHSGPAGADTALDRSKRGSNPLNIDLSPAPSPGDGPEFSAHALRDSKYLPVQIAGLVAAYGLSLVLVAAILLFLSKKRREHLQLGISEIDYQTPKPLYGDESPIDGFNPIPLSNPRRQAAPSSPYPPPVRIQIEHQPFASHDNARNTQPPPMVACNAAEAGPSVDQPLISAHDETAQSQLDVMYKNVLEQEDAMQRGIVWEEPVSSGPCDGIPRSDEPAAGPRKYRVKPAMLKLKAAAHGDKTHDDKSQNDKTHDDKARHDKTQNSNTHGDKPQSKTSAFFASLRSPRKKQVKGVNISSPIMTPRSDTFPRHESQEMSAISPRNYAPLRPPPIPTDQIPFGARVRKNRGPPLTLTPESLQSIDQRINAAQPDYSKAHDAISAVDPASATSETPLVCPSDAQNSHGNPASTLPLSPKPGATFSRANAPSAVRTGGNLPLRAYEPAMSSPAASSHTTKQTVFERRGPLSPTTGRTLMTGGAVPYSPYQPFTPVVPITPSLVTKEDRKRMRKLAPKTPTMEMVKDSDELW